MNNLPQHNSSNISLYSDIHENYITTPMNLYSGNPAPKLSSDALGEIIQQLEQYIKKNPIETLAQSNTMYWLAHALHCAVQNNNDSHTLSISKLITVLFDKNPHSLIELFNQVINVGELKGQTIAFAFMNELYSAVINCQENQIIAIHLIFNLLFNVNNNELAPALLHPVQGGIEKGKNALLLLIESLETAARERYNQPTTVLLSLLLLKCIKSSPDIYFSALTKAFDVGPYKGKNSIYMLARTLKISARDNPPIVKTICDILIMTNTFNPEALQKSLFQTIKSGSFEGYNSLNILLTGLVSAAYITKNDEVIHDITFTLEQLFKFHPDEMSNALFEVVSQGENKSENGIVMLLQALIVSISHNNEALYIANFLYKIIENDPKKLGIAFIHPLSQEHVRYKNMSPLLLVIDNLNSNDNAGILTKTLLQKLALSQSAIQMMISLPANEKSKFLDEFAIAHNLSNSDKLWLFNATSDDFKQKFNHKAEDITTKQVLSQLNSYTNNSHLFFENDIPKENTKQPNENNDTINAKKS